ncbi:phage head-tail joining protein [Hyphomonas sp. ND6WE1B]|uniref:phage head-tail joining protein n=1 Tax=Hyphomonas sp. ND6WE1B TaxID=1848191 RepID=UPI0008075D31|nr:hypothetical protein [Hyphomonas sp. ND6WE1B]
MALTVSELTTMRDELIKARSNGVRSVRDQNGEEVTYSSDREMAAAIAALDRQIAAASRPTPNTLTFQTSKGV